MAPRGMKRGAQDGKKADSKKARADPTTVAIEEVIKSAELPTSCRDMLLASVSASLETPADKRHNIQISVVEMLEELIVAREASHQSKIEDTKRAESESESAQARLLSIFTTAEATLEQKIKMVQERTSTLAAAREKVETAKTVLAERKETQQVGDATYQQAKETKDAVQKAIETDLPATIGGVSDCAQIVPLLKQVGVDESLVTALPGTCAKAPSDRGSFDAMVLTQLENSLKERLADFSTKIEIEFPAVEARAVEVADAEKALAEANAQAEIATSSHAAAEVERGEADVAVQAAKSELEAYELPMLRAVTAREKAMAALEKFQNCTRAPFEILRDATSLAAPSDEKVIEPDASSAITVGGA